MEQNLLKYPRKSHRKKIKIPRNSCLLAEFLGIVFGDGGIGNPWQLVITLNAISDNDYSHYLEQIINKLFQIKPVIWKRPKENTLRIICSSTSLVDFLIKKGCVKGNKVKQQLDIPSWIKKVSSYKKAFVRGLVDTDGCLYIHKHHTKGKLYKNIGFCFTSASLPLLKSVGDILRENNIKPHYRGKQRIFLYGETPIKRYLKIFGSSNSRIINKYKKWRGAGVV